MTGEPCPACPVEVRDLSACAHNAYVEFRANVAAQGLELPTDWSRFHRKMTELGEALARWQPVVDAHFAAGHKPDARTPRREVGALVRVCDLIPGDLVEDPGMEDARMSATLLGWSTPHPRYPGLALVLWAVTGGGFSVDALPPEQVVGELRGRTHLERLAALTQALPYRPGQAGS